MHSDLMPLRGRQVTGVVAELTGSGSNSATAGHFTAKPAGQAADPATPARHSTPYNPAGMDRSADVEVATTGAERVAESLP